MGDKKISIVLEFLRKGEQVWKESIRDVDDFKLRLSGLERQLQQFASAATLYKIGGIFKESIHAATMLQNSMTGLAAVARHAGEDLGQSMSAATRISADGLINIRASAQALQNLLARGFTLQESIDILERLKDAAAFNRQAHLSMSDAVASATEGIKNENSVLVDNAGVTKNVSVMWKEYAQAIGRGVDSLTQAEKRQAEYNGIMRETAGQIGNATLAANGMTGASARLENEVFKLKAALGEGLAPAYYAVAKAANYALDVLRMFLGGIEITSARMALWFSRAEKLVEWAKSGFAGGFQSFQNQIQIMNKEFDAQAEEIAKKWDGALKPPALGPDTGARRQDIQAPDTAAKDAAKKLGKQMEAIADEVHKAYHERIAKLSKENKSALAILGFEQEAEAQAGKEAEAIAEEVHRAYQAHIDKLGKENASALRIFEMQQEAYFQNLAQAGQGSFKWLQDLSQRTAEAMEKNFSDLFFDVLQGKFRTLADYATGMLNSIQRAVADYMGQLMKVGLFGTGEKGSSGLLQTVGSALGKAVGGLFGGGGADIDYSAGSGTAIIEHAGGVVGRDGGRRSVPASLFFNAPRLHGGLMGDEFPAILQRGETVLPRGAGAPATYVTVINNTGQQSEQKETRTARGDRSIIVQIGEALAQDVKGGGPLHQAIRKTFGMSPAVGGR